MKRYAAQGTKEREKSESKTERPKNRDRLRRNRELCDWELRNILSKNNKRRTKPIENLINQKNKFIN